MITEKPIGVIYCTADLRTDRCPAKISDNDYITVTSACLRCEHSKVRHFKRGLAIAEIGKKDEDDKKEYTSDDVRTTVCPKCGTVNEVDAKKAIFSLVVCTKCEHHFYTTKTNIVKRNIL